MLLTGIPLRDMVAACTVGYLESTPLLDLNHLEEAGDGACLTLAAHSNRDTAPLLQLDEKLPMETLETVRVHAWILCWGLAAPSNVLCR